MGKLFTKGTKFENSMVEGASVITHSGSIGGLLECFKGRQKIFLRLSSQVEGNVYAARASFTCYKKRE